LANCSKKRLIYANCSIFSGWRDPTQDRFSCCSRTVRAADCSLSFELDAMDAVLGHGFHPLKARQRRSIPNLQTVHRHGRIPQ
jgi:hypothetical protein